MFFLKIKSPNFPCKLKLIQPWFPKLNRRWGKWGKQERFGKLPERAATSAARVEYIKFCVSYHYRSQNDRTPIYRSPLSCGLICDERNFIFPQLLLRLHRTHLKKPNPSNQVLRSFHPVGQHNARQYIPSYAVRQK